MSANNDCNHEEEEEEENDAREECWDLPPDFDLYATHEVKTVRYPPELGRGTNGRARDRSFRIECIEPDTPLDINNRTQSSSACDATGHCVWAGAFLLLQCLRDLAALDVVVVGGRRLIELGCGTGIGGLALLLAADYDPSLVPSHVCFTDNDPDALRVCERNCRRNDLPASSYATAELAWGEDVRREMEGGFDVALATDVLYDVDLIVPLFGTAARCLPSGGAFVLSHIPRACYNEGNPPRAVEDLEKYIVDEAAGCGFRLVGTLRPPDEDGFSSVILDWCPATAFVGGGILIFRKS